MSHWLAVQIVYAAIAWFFAARAVLESFRTAGFSGRPLAATVRELRKSDRRDELPRLAALLTTPLFEAVFALDRDEVSVDELVVSARHELSNFAPPVRTLRALATIGTMLGLLAAIATLHTVLLAEHGDVGASGAFDCAVAGFLTALPCWAAVALCRRRAGQAVGELELVLLALRSPVGGAGGPSETAEQPGAVEPKTG